MSGIKFPTFSSTVPPDVSDNDHKPLGDSDGFDAHVNLGWNGQDNVWSDHQGEYSPTQLESFLRGDDETIPELSKSLDFPIDDQVNHNTQLSPSELLRALDSDMSDDDDDSTSNNLSHPTISESSMRLQFPTGAFTSNGDGPSNNASDQTTSQPSKGLEFPTGAVTLNGENTSNNPSQESMSNLLQAVATVGANANFAQSRALSQLQSRSSLEPFFSRSFPPEAPVSKPHAPAFRQPGEPEEDKQLDSVSGKRRKVRELERDARAREHELWGSDEQDAEEDSASNDQDFTPNDTAGTVGLGIKAAAALFKKPSKASTHYTRPVMSKMFTNLELTPEEFVHLQASAKSFMLDANHKDRFDCVGERGDKGHTDMTKLKLFSCAEEFLDGDGWGERCWGVNAMEAERKKLKWPKMKPSIITLIVPLLRKMVTNEKQRRYAMQARIDKRGGRPKKRGWERQQALLQAQSVSPSAGSPQSNVENGQSPSIDPSLSRYSYAIVSTGRENTPTPQNGTTGRSLVPSGESGNNGVQYQVSIMHNGLRIKPRFTLTPAACPGFPSLLQHIQIVMHGGSLAMTSVNILGPGGLVNVIDEEGWVGAIRSVKDCVWMDGEVKCVVQVKDFSHLGRH